MLNRRQFLKSLSILPLSFAAGKESTTLHAMRRRALISPPTYTVNSGASNFIANVVMSGLDGAALKTSPPVRICLNLPGTPAGSP